MLELLIISIVGLTIAQIIVIRTIPGLWMICAMLPIVGLAINVMMSIALVYVLGAGLIVGIAGIISSILVLILIK